MTVQTTYPVAVISGMSAESPGAAQAAMEQVQSRYEGAGFVSEIATVNGFARTLAVLGEAWPVPIYVRVMDDADGTPGGVTKEISTLTQEELDSITGVEVHVQIER